MLKSTLTVLTLPSLCGVACAAVPAGSPRTEDGPSKPDIILILTDQQSYNTISALGHTLASTPNLDRLVRQGITFTNAYCANPLSVPSRYALFTGTSPAGVGVWGNADRNTDAEKIRQAQEQSIGAVFRRAGYQTLYGGKIHLPNAKNKSKFAGTDNYFFEYIEKDERELLARNVGTLLREREATQPMLLVVSFLNPHDICFEARTDAEVDRLKAQTIVQMRALADGADPAESAASRELRKNGKSRSDPIPVQGLYDRLLASLPLHLREVGRVGGPADRRGPRCCRGLGKPGQYDCGLHLRPR